MTTDKDGYPLPTGRCQSCELELEAFDGDHIQPSLRCANPQCQLVDRCLTCQMLAGWFMKQDEVLGEGL